MMAHWQSETIRSNGIRIHYTRTGGTKPPILLAHGFSDAGLCWTPVAEVLAEKYDVIMTDARYSPHVNVPVNARVPMQKRTFTDPSK